MFNYFFVYFLSCIFIMDIKNIKIFAYFWVMSLFAIFALSKVFIRRVCA